MKILVGFSSSWQSYIANSEASVHAALMADPDCIPLDQYDSLGRPPVDAFIEDCYGPNPPDWLPKDVVRIRKIIDLHRFTAERCQMFTDSVRDYDLILSPLANFRNRPAIYHYPPSEVMAKLVVFPHVVPAMPPPTIPWCDRAGGLVSGCVHPLVYPWRFWVRSLSLSGVDVLEHPGYDSIDKMTEARKSYFETLSSYRAAFTCNMILDYTVAKYVEIPYAGCVLNYRAPNPVDAELLGLKDGVNCLFVPYGDEDALRAAYWRATQDDAAGIAAAGQALMVERHTAPKRIAYLKRVIAWYREHRRVPSVEEQRGMFLGG